MTVFVQGNGADILDARWRRYDPQSSDRLPGGWWRVVAFEDGWWTDAPVIKPLVWQGDYA